MHRTTVMVVLLGGGWTTLKEFIKIHDPCKSMYIRRIFNDNNLYTFYPSIKLLLQIPVLTSSHCLIIVIVVASNCLIISFVCMYVVCIALLQGRMALRS